MSFPSSSTVPTLDDPEMADAEARSCTKMEGFPGKGEGGQATGYPWMKPPPTPDLTKKYRLRPINFANGSNLYRKYFQAVVARWISAFQLTLGLATLITELMKMIMGQEWNWNGGLNVMGTVALVTAAASVTIAAANHSSYCRLHSAMAFHILNGVVQYLLVEQVYGGDIPRMRTDFVEETKEDAVFNYENAWIACLNRDRNCTLEVLEKAESKDVEHLHAFYRIKLTLAGMTLIYGAIQLVLSVVLALMTGRAICCGKMSLERKFYEIESLRGGESGQGQGRTGQFPLPPRPFPGGHAPGPGNDKEMMVFQRKESENSDASIVSPCPSPAPYSNVSATPRSSEDVDMTAADAAGTGPLEKGGVHEHVQDEQEMKSIELQSPPPYTEK